MGERYIHQYEDHTYMLDHEVQYRFDQNRARNWKLGVSLIPAIIAITAASIIWHPEWLGIALPCGLALLFCIIAIPSLIKPLPCSTCGEKMRHERRERHHYLLCDPCRRYAYSHMDSHDRY